MTITTRISDTMFQGRYAANPVESSNYNPYAQVGGWEPLSCKLIGRIDYAGWKKCRGKKDQRNELCHRARGNDFAKLFSVVRIIRQHMKSALQNRQMTGNTLQIVKKLADQFDGQYRKIARYIVSMSEPEIADMTAETINLDGKVADRLTFCEVMEKRHGRIMQVLGLMLGYQNVQPLRKIEFPPVSDYNPEPICWEYPDELISEANKETKMELTAVGNRVLGRKLAVNKDFWKSLKEECDRFLQLTTLLS